MRDEKDSTLKWFQFGEAMSTVWSEGFLYKVAPPELKISPIMYFGMYNSIVQAKVPKIIVPIKQKILKFNFYYKKMIILIKIDIDKQGQNGTTIFNILL